MNVENVLSAVYGLMNQCLDRRALAANAGKTDAAEAYGWMADQLASYLRLSPRTKKREETHPILVDAGRVLFEKRVKELRAEGMDVDFTARQITDELVRATNDGSWLLRQAIIEDQVAQVQV